MSFFLQSSKFKSNSYNYKANYTFVYKSNKMNISLIFFLAFLFILSYPSNAEKNNSSFCQRTHRGILKYRQKKVLKKYPNIEYHISIHINYNPIHVYLLKYIFENKNSIYLIGKKWIYYFISYFESWYPRAIQVMNI